MLQSSIAMLDNSLQPLVDKLSKTTPFISAGLFVKDKFYKNEANTASIVNTPVVPFEFIEFTESSVRGRRVDLTSTALGKTFTTHQSQLEISKLDPKHHITWGVYTQPAPGHEAVLQLIFDRQQSQLINESLLPELVYPTLAPIWRSTALLVKEGEHKQDIPLADELLLNVPATPNAYIIKWDVLKSTRHIAHNYPLLRHYLLQFELTLERFLNQYGGRITEYEGDSQNIVIDLPGSMDRSNLVDVGTFGRMTALPFVQHLITFHDSLALHYPELAPKIRICLGLGYVEQVATGEVTGPIFWELAGLLRNESREQLTINQAAQIVMRWSTEYDGHSSKTKMNRKSNYLLKSD